MSRGKSIRDRVVCPFYQKHGRQVVVCEALSTEADACAQSFGTQHARYLYMCRRCCTFAYGRCPLAAALMAKYPE